MQHKEIIQKSSTFFFRTYDSRVMIGIMGDSPRAKKATANIRFGDLAPAVQRIAKLVPRETENSLVRRALEALIETVDAREPVLPGFAAEIIFSRMTGALPQDCPRALTMTEAQDLFGKARLPKDVMPGGPAFFMRDTGRPDVVTIEGDGRPAADQPKKLTERGPPSSFGKKASSPAELFPQKPKSRQPRRPGQRGVG